MTSVKTVQSKTWSQWNKLFELIENETKRRSIESHLEKIADWQERNRELNDRVLVLMVSILSNEYKRKRIQLLSKRGRQPATRWLEQLSQDSNRMSDETNLLLAISCDDRGECRDQQSTRMILERSLSRSIHLVENSLTQVEKRRDDAEYSANESVASILAASRASLELARSIQH